MRSIPFLVLMALFAGAMLFQGVSAAGFHIPTVDEGLLQTNGCYIGAYLGGNQGVNNLTCVNWYQKAQDFPYETQILDHPSEYGENTGSGLNGIDTGINTFRTGVDAITPGSGKKQLLFSRYYGMQYFPDNDYGKIKYTESEPCYVWIERVLQQGGVPVLVLYPWSLKDTAGYLDLSASNSHLPSMSGEDMMKYIAQNCSALSKKYQDSKGNYATILICFGLEFNTAPVVNPDSQDTTDNPNKKAWRRMYREAYEIVRANANPSVQMVWAGNIAQNKADRIWYWPGTGENGEDLGKDYVDWVGMTWYPWNNGPKSLDNLAGFYQYYAKDQKHPMIFMETSADGDGDPIAERSLKEEHISYLYNPSTLAEYPNIKGIIWFNVIKGEGTPMVRKNFVFPDGTWDNHGNSTSKPGTLSSVSNPNLMMTSLYPKAILDNYFLAPPGQLLTADFDLQVNHDQLTVKCYDVSIGDGVSSWNWDVNGDQRPEYHTKNITHRYPKAGTYTITMKISDGARTISHTKTVQIGSGTQEKAFISLGSIPPKAVVWVDNQIRIGSTTSAKQRFMVPAGTHLITLKMDGYQDWTGTYSLKWPQIRDLGVVKLQKGAGQSTVSSPMVLPSGSDLPVVNSLVSPQITAKSGLIQTNKILETGTIPGSGTGFPSPVA